MVDSRVQDADLDFLKDIQDLKVLDLRGTQISDAGIEKIVPLKTLQSVMFTRTHVSPDGIKKLKQARPDLAITR